MLKVTVVWFWLMSNIFNYFSSGTLKLALRRVALCFDRDTVIDITTLPYSQWMYSSPEPSHLPFMCFCLIGLLDISLGEIYSGAFSHHGGWQSKHH